MAQLLDDYGLYLHPAWVSGARRGVTRRVGRHGAPPASQRTVDCTYVCTAPHLPFLSVHPPQYVALLAEHGIKMDYVVVKKSTSKKTF